MRRIMAAGALVALALTLAACGEKSDRIQPTPADAQSIGLALDWLPNADHVGIYTAQTDGMFRRAGLNVAIHVPNNPAEPLALLESGRVDVAISYEPEVMLARSQGQMVVGFGAIVQRPLTSVIALGSKHIHSIADLRGKTIGTAGIPYQRAYLKTMLAHAHVPASSVKVVNVGSNLVGAMLSGRVAATLGGFSNYEAIELRLRHKHPTVIPVSRGGVPSYDELVLATTATYLAHHSNELRRLVQAIGRGYAAVRADPAAGVRALDTADPSLDPKLEAAAVKATLPAFFPGGGHPFGWQFQSRWNAFGKWMTGQGLIDGPRAWYGASTNQLLAGQGP
jgi:putative hydroxymethylpyrimidine transport system substrate-binding protein